MLSAAMQRGEALRGVAERARQLGQQIVRWVAHDQESIAMCPRCRPGCMSGLTRSRRWRTVRRSITSARAARVPRALQKRAERLVAAGSGRAGYRPARRDRSPPGAPFCRSGHS